MTMTLADLKPGDKAVVEHGGMNAGRTIVTVTKAHKLHVFTDDRGHEQRWRKDSGYPVGANGYHIPTLLPGTPALLAEVRAENRKKRLCAALRDTDWAKLTLPQLEAIYTALTSDATETP